jgi:proline iminopeptidase
LATDDPSFDDAIRLDQSGSVVPQQRPVPAERSGAAGLTPPAERIVVADDGARLWASRAGRGVPVVCCHGGPGLWDMFGPVSDLLAGSASVHRWDQRGCGRSERMGPYSIARTLADLDAVRCSFGVEQMILLGHSWGAQLALLYALEHPDRVDKLVYVSGTGIDPDGPWHDAYARSLRQRLGARRGRWEALKRRERTMEEDRELAVLQWSADFADGTDGVAQAEVLATPWLGVNFELNATINAETTALWASTDLDARCRTLRVPTLVLDGTDDIRPRSSVDSLERALPHVRREALDGAGHLPWVDDPDGFRAAVLGFLDG